MTVENNGLKISGHDCPRHMAVVGMFDGVHLGHRFLIGRLKDEAMSRGLRPMAVTFTNHPLEVIAPQKAPLLLTDAARKESLLRQEGVMPVMLPFDSRLRDTGAADFLLMLKSRYGVEALMLGFNNRFGHDAPRDFDTYRTLGRQCGVDIVLAPEFRCQGEKISSSAVREAVSQGDMTRAAAMLGRLYSVTGPIVHGHMLGRTIGFPTANVAAGNRILLPAPGVYAAVATRENGETLAAMVNIGRRPTVENEASAPVSVEANLLGFSGDIYGEQLQLEFVARMRSERRFHSLEALKTQLEADRREAAEIVAAMRG